MATPLMMTGISNVFEWLIRKLVGYANPFKWGLETSWGSDIENSHRFLTKKVKRKGGIGLDNVPRPNAFPILFYQNFFFREHNCISHECANFGGVTDAHWIEDFTMPLQDLFSNNKREKGRKSYSWLCSCFSNLLLFLKKATFCSLSYKDKILWLVLFRKPNHHYFQNFRIRYFFSLKLALESFFNT